MAPESVAFAREKLETPSGEAMAFNVMKMHDLGYDVARIPYSIRVLLENAMRNSDRAEGALEAAHLLAAWPSSIGKDVPFMPYRVLLQDYTGVPLIVDLAAMRDAAKRAGVDPGRVNSKVPVDLVIDHSIQVDAWGDELAFGVNLSKEYERNSERYALLKWAQGSFEKTRVFPPGKGICHQFNLEYLSKVVVTSRPDGVLEAHPDTLIGTDSHTTMVNGLGCLGWGVGGIEAEAVMLGEPYPMPIPKVVGVRLSGSLREGVTPTDLVLHVTERLRQTDVVGAFVEYFGEGYSELSVPDRATLGNMSPEYGATAGYCPIDDRTLSYLTGSARPRSHVDFVERYARRFGFFKTGEEPTFSEVIPVDLEKVESSIAGPRNPEERHALSSVPVFARSLLGTSAPSAQRAVDRSASGSMQTLVSRSSPGAIPDGGIVISAITSCTNTSNPTVMVGAGLIARRAVEAGLTVKPWVKPSLAPGSTVVTDYLQAAGLLSYLERLGFAVVGYGCTTCIAEGTPVLLADGTARPIESMPRGGGALVFGPSGDGSLGIARQAELMARGTRECVTLVLQDGRTLVCTPDHRLLCSDGRWVRADELVMGVDQVVTGLDCPVDSPSDDETAYALRAGTRNFTMGSALERAQTLAFARLLGYLLGDGSVSAAGQGRVSVGQAIDREMVLNDIELLTGLRPAASRYDDRRWSIVLPSSLTSSIVALPGVKTGRRIGQPPTLPAFVTESNCPRAVVREFLGGLFGADGHAPKLHYSRTSTADASLQPPAYSLSTIPELLGHAKTFVSQVVSLLARCGVETGGARTYTYRTRRSTSTYAPPIDGIQRIEVRLTLPDGLSFVEKVGFRYCVNKTMRATAAAVYWRLVGGIQEQRLWMAEQLEAVHLYQPTMSFSNARQAVATLLVGHESEASVPPVVAPHYALLEGHDRFSRLPQSTGRRFQPLHRENYSFPSPSDLFTQIGAREWFPPPPSRHRARSEKWYAVSKEAMTIPSLSLKVVDRRPAGVKAVYDIAVDGVHAFVAATFAVHNCIGNSGPLAKEVEEEVKSRDLYAVAALSGNRNFDGRIHPLVRGAFLMSPMLVVAYALAGRIDFDFSSTPLGSDSHGHPVFLKDIWPSLSEIKWAVERSLGPELFTKRYADAMKGDERWESLHAVGGTTYGWDERSTYIRQPGWFEGTASSLADIKGARVLAMLGDKVTTDHISPAGSIAVDSPAGKYLLAHGVGLADFSTYGSRRGNHEVLVRGGFSNIRLRNSLANGKEGGYTSHFPDGEVLPIYDAAVKYAKEGIPLVVIAGKQYGQGSSRDWAAKAPKMLGVRAVVAESFERIHRSNLVAMGIFPLQFRAGEGAAPLGLKGDETYEVTGLSAVDGPGKTAHVTAKSGDAVRNFDVVARVENSAEVGYLRSGGVLPYVFDKLRSS